MAEQTGIEWCDATFNPWWGCEKVSPGCAHCYADTLSQRYAKGEQLWGEGHSFRFFGDKHWAEPLKWARLMPGKLGRRPRVFCASMADVFEDHPALVEPRLRLFALIAATPELDWLILTKRPEVARELMADRFWWAKVEGTAQRIHEERTGEDVSMSLAVHGPLPNVWMGTSIENARHTWRADVLREIPAAKRFISAEPLLGSLFPERERHAVGCKHLFGDTLGRGTVEHCVAKLNLSKIDWVIVGGESGKDARPMHPDWARQIRDTCLGMRYGDLNAESTEHPAFLFKQWGEWSPGEADYEGSSLTGNRRVVRRGMFLDRDGRERDLNELSVFSVPDDWARLARFGKKASGRLLDGREWNEFPT